MRSPQILSVRIAPPRHGAGEAIRRRLRSLLYIARLWHERARQRRQLQFLSDHMLRDLGLTRVDVQIEASKPFWRA